ncbi:MAG: acyl-CoA dehydrogenase family protein, partial [Pseudomonadota bacterium]
MNYISNPETLPPEFGRLESLRATVESQSATIEAQRCVPAELIEELSQAGLFITSVPEKFGGSQLDALDTMKLLEQLSYVDSAVGWCGMIYSTTAVLGSFLPEEWGHEVYGVRRDGDKIHGPITAGGAAPSGKGKVVDGGIVVSGRWAWGSGSHHANWICGGTMVQDGDDLRRFPNGEPMVYVMFFEKDQVKLHDNWDPSGLKGTGSVDFEVTEQFVPEGRWTVLGRSRRQIDSPLYRFPFFGYFASAVATVPLGIARRALDDFADLAKGKVPTARSSTLSESSIAQLEFGQAEALVAGAHHYLYGAVQSMWDKLSQGKSASLDDKRHLRLAASQSTIMSAAAVDKLYNAAGGTALQGYCSLQRHFRDIHTATQHRMVSPEIL